MSDPGAVKLEREGDFVWRVPREGRMRVDGVIFANERLMESIAGDQSVQQVMNVATLPGIVKASYAMPDIHWGYGFPIGGVAAFDPEEGGVISPGGVGYDINCGVRLLRTNLEKKDVVPRVKELVEGLFRNIPSGVGGHRKDIRLSPAQVRDVLKKGARWAVENGHGDAQDLERIESFGTLPDADPSAVSERAIERGKSQLGTLGSGNHFIEVEFVEEVYDQTIAEAFGLFPGQICVAVHSGSRGLGYQVCDDYLDLMLRASQKYGIELADRQLCSAPLHSPEARQYLAAMQAAANYAFCNRQMMGHYVRETFEHLFGRSWESLGMDLVYDLAHNIAKFEEHEVDGERRRLCVHRKGATRAFPPGHPEVQPVYRAVGQPVFIPGDMGRYSFVLVGTEQAFRQTFGSCCHGAGRMMSRVKAKKTARGRRIYEELEAKGIFVRSATLDGVLEEIPEAYKDVADVVDVVHGAGLARRVAKLRPIGVVKG